jgi:hypothetical protein
MRYAGLVTKTGIRKKSDFRYGEAANPRPTSCSVAGNVLRAFPIFAALRLTGVRVPGGLEEAEPGGGQRRGAAGAALMSYGAIRQYLAVPCRTHRLSLRGHSSRRTTLPSSLRSSGCGLTRSNVMDNIHCVDCSAPTQGKHGLRVNSYQIGRVHVAAL